MRSKLTGNFIKMALLVATLGHAAAGEIFSISSSAFAKGDRIPSRFASVRENHSPPLTIGQVPTKARSLALIVDDPDAPAGLWTHWLVWNLPVTATSIPEAALPPEAREGRNSFGNVRYDGPAPPHGIHRYFFHLYALDESLQLPAGASREELEAAIKGHILGEAETFGVYQAAP